MQNDRSSFERARNEVDLGVLGDPERWGGTAQFSTLLPVNPKIVTPQIIRAQTADLTARAWSLLVAWNISNLAPTDTISRCAFELTIGVGQASWTIALDLSNSLAGYPAVIGPIPAAGQMPPVAWEVIPAPGGYASGVVMLPWGLPAAAIAGRFILEIDPGLPPHFRHKIGGMAFACVAPRAI